MHYYERFSVQVPLYIEAKRAHNGAMPANGGFAVASLSESQDTRLVAGVQSSYSAEEAKHTLCRTSAGS